MSRSHKSRRGFKIDTILERLMSKNNQEQTLGVRGYMTLTFLGFYDKKSKVLSIINWYIQFLYNSLNLFTKYYILYFPYLLYNGYFITVEASQDPVKVETLLLKICHKKRKDVSSPIMQVSLSFVKYTNYILFYVLI